MNNEDKLKAALKNDAALRDAIKLDEMEAPKMPADLNARLMQRVAQEQAPVATRTRKLWPWIAAACAIAFIAVFVTPPKDISPKGDATTATPAIVAKVDKPAVQPVEASAPAPEAAPVSVPAPAAKAAPKAPKAAPVAPKAAPMATPAPQQVEPAVLAAATTAQPAVAQQKTAVLSERDIPITRPENYKYTPEELAQLKKQAAEAYLKWVELEMEISRNNMQTAQAKD